MAQKFYQKASVQSAFVAGIFLIIGALITIWPQIKNNKTKQDVINANPQKNTIPSPLKKQEPNKIYQNNKPVGEITGKIKINGDDLFLEELSETSDLKRDMPFEYQEVKYIIVEIKKEIREYMSMQRKKEFVLKSVLCKKFK